MSGATDVDVMPSDMPKLSASASSPFLPNLDTLSVDNAQLPIITTTNQTNECKDNLKQQLPLNLFFTTSHNTTVSLQLSELIETNTTNTETDKVDPTTSKQVKFKLDSSTSQDYNVGDLVITSPNKQGLIRYIGALHGDAHIWFGIEIIGGTKGYNDGSFQGHRYFTCGIHQGIFVKKHQIVRKMTTTDFENAKPKRPKTAKKKEKNEKRSSLTDIDLKRVQRKPGPREIGRISSTSNWTPIEDADHIIEQALKSDRGRSKQRQRPKTAKYASTESRTRSISRHEMMKAKSKVRINKSVTLIPGSFDKLRSKTPTPSRYGLTVIKQKSVESDDDNNNNNKSNRSTVKATFTNSGRGRSVSRNVNSSQQRKKKKRKKEKRKNGRSRSKTVQYDRNALTKSKSVPDKRRPMITFSFEDRKNVNTGFPDIAQLGNNKSEPRGRKKKKKKKGIHIQSKSQGNDEGDAPPMVIIRVSSAADVSSRKYLSTQGLNMSKTSTICMDTNDENDDLLFAEVNAEIEERKSGFMELEEQLNALGMEDFDKQFENSLLQTQNTQHQFTKRHSALVDKLEFDLVKDLKIEENDGLNSNKIKSMLWSDLKPEDTDD